MLKNYYEILGVSENATQEEIKRAYRKQAKKYHPDINKDPNAEMIMQNINEAYEILSVLSSRQKYDIKLAQERKYTSSTSKQPSSQRTYHASYTKTREESEKNFEDWLKEYLKTMRAKKDFSDYDINIKNTVHLLKRLKRDLINNTKNINIINKDNLEIINYDKYDGHIIKKLKFK